MCWLFILAEPCHACVEFTQILVYFCCVCCCSAEVASSISAYESKLGAVRTKRAALETELDAVEREAVESRRQMEEDLDTEVSRGGCELQL